ncbi:hypothetical protein ACTFIY_004799 [Dictyostelium cf. discoideum]
MSGSKIGYCINKNPIIRGLALRKYATIEINRSLTDFSGYVRKTTLLGLAKLYHLSKEPFDLDIIMPKIFDMIMDQDPQVIVNAVSTLNEIKPGWSFIFDLVQHLIIRYINDRLSHSNSTLTLSTIKIFLKYTDEFEEIQEHVCERIKEPFITSTENSESNETPFTILHHIHLLMTPTTTAPTTTAPTTTAPTTTAPSLMIWSFPLEENSCYFNYTPHLENNSNKFPDYPNTLDSWKIKSRMYQGSSRKDVLHYYSGEDYLVQDKNIQDLFTINILDLNFPISDIPTKKEEK